MFDQLDMLLGRLRGRAGADAAGALACSTSPSVWAMCEHGTYTEPAPVQAAGASVKRIVITRLVGHTYYARLVRKSGMQAVA